MAGRDILYLASMLDDEDENVAVGVLAELLDRSDELGDLPALLQESDIPLVRRRAHQLQAALTFRRRRQDFFEMLNAPEPRLIVGLMNIHLLWFDKDSFPALVKQWQGVQQEVFRRPHRTLDELLYCLHRLGFAPELETTMRPENYCIGSIMDQKYGSGALLSGIIRELAEEPAEFRVVRMAGEFGIYDGERILLGAGDWRIVPSPGTRQLEFWNTRSLLRFGAATLLNCAVNSDSFRYILTIAQALSGDNGDRVLDYFPYPYRPDFGPEEQNPITQHSEV